MGDLAIGQVADLARSSAAQMHHHDGGGYGYPPRASAGAGRQTLALGIGEPASCTGASDVPLVLGADGVQPPVFDRGRAGDCAKYVTLIARSLVE